MPFSNFVFVSAYEIIKIKNTKCCHECSFKLIVIATIRCDCKKHKLNHWEFDK